MDTPIYMHGVSPREHAHRTSCNRCIWTSRTPVFFSARQHNYML